MEQNMMLSDVLFCPLNSPKPLDMKCIVMYDQEMQHNFTSENLKNGLNYN